MKTLSEYLDQVDNFEKMSQKDQVKIISYLHSIVSNSSSFTLADVKKAFESADLILPANLSRELSRLSSEKPSILIKKGNSFSFERTAKRTLDGQISTSTLHVTDKLRPQKLYNVYLHAANRKQAKYALKLAEINSLIEAINEDSNTVLVGGRRFDLKPFETIKVYDFSKGLTSLDNIGVIKEEMHRIGKILGGRVTDLYRHFGVDVTSNFFIAPYSNEKSDTATKNTPPRMKKIFISHSSKDRAIVEKLIDLVESVGVTSDNIFCSSYEGYGVDLGENFLERLKDELNGDITVLFLLTKNFYSSPICLCEMGAAWVKTRYHIPILVPPFGFNDIQGVIPHTHGMKINESHNLNSLKVKLEEQFAIKAHSNPSIWERKRDNIINQINSLIASEVSEN